MLSRQGIWVTLATSGKELMWCIDFTSRTERETHIHTQIASLILQRLHFCRLCPLRLSQGLVDSCRASKPVLWGKLATWALFLGYCVIRDDHLDSYFLFYYYYFGGILLFLTVWLWEMVSIEIAIGKAGWNQQSLGIYSLLPWLLPLHLMWLKVSPVRKI